MEKRNSDVNRQKEIAKSLLEIGTEDDVIEVITRLHKDDIAKLRLEKDVIMKNFSVDKSNEDLYN